jgi:hypothetical protein
VPTPNSWDVPPLPDHGDDDIDTTFAGVGRVLTQWESIELELSVIYAVFMGRPGDSEASREYGRGRTFTDRAKMVAERAEKSLRNQALEDEFDQIMCAIRHFADRRNEVAHGIVRPIHWIMPGRIQQTDYNFKFCLVPSYYNYKKYGPDNLPEYMYISETLLDLEKKLFYLAAETESFRSRIVFRLSRS